MSPCLWYFAYGSNMSRTIFVERRGMQPSASTWGWLDGYRLSFDLPVGPGERGVANLARQVGARTCGVLHCITADEADRLDRTEGVHLGYYRSIVVPVVTPAKQTIAAFTYQSPRVSPGRKPSRRYLGLLLDGAREHGLPSEYIALLHGFELARDERDPQP